MQHFDSPGCSCASARRETTGANVCREGSRRRPLTRVEKGGQCARGHRKNHVQSRTFVRAVGTISSVAQCLWMHSHKNQRREGHFRRKAVLTTTKWDHKFSTALRCKGVDICQLNAAGFPRRHDVWMSHKRHIFVFFSTKTRQASRPPSVLRVSSPGVRLRLPGDDGRQVLALPKGGA